MPKRKITLTKRFYTGSARMTSTGDMHNKLSLYGEAIELAKKRLAQNDREQEVYVVEVVAIVRREEKPVIIEEVRRD